jgi:hypothetical protein
LPSITPETQANHKSPAPDCSDDPSPLPKPDNAKFHRYQFFNALTLSLAIMMNMMSVFDYYCKHIQNPCVAWLNYLTNAYTYTSATMTLLASRYINPPCTGPVKDFLSDIICHS